MSQQIGSSVQNNIINKTAALNKISFGENNATMNSLTRKMTNLGWNLEPGLLSQWCYALAQVIH